MEIRIGFDAWGSIARTHAVGLRALPVLFPDLPFRPVLHAVGNRDPGKGEGWGRRGRVGGGVGCVPIAWGPAVGDGYRAAVDGEVAGGAQDWIGILHLRLRFDLADVGFAGSELAGLEVGEQVAHFFGRDGVGFGAAGA